MIYLASPYSHPLWIKREQRYKQVLACCARLITDGLHVYSPIVHNHQIAFFHQLPTDAAYWKSTNEEMIRLCEQFYVLKLEDWVASIGVISEIAYATRLGKPITYIDA